MIFKDTVSWDLSPFQEQNCIFDLYECHQENIPKEYFELIHSTSKKLFYIDASVGLGGYVIAKEMNLI